MTVHLAIAFALLAGASVFAVLALVIGRNRHPPGARHMAIAMAGVAVWYAAAAGEVIAGADRAAFLLLRNLKYVGIVAVVPGFFLFVWQYAYPQRAASRTRLLVYLIPLLTLALVFTNPLHELMWQHPPALPLSGEPRTPWGAWFRFVYAPHAYVLLALAVLLLVREVLRPHAAQRAQAAVLLLAALIPFAVNVAYVYGPPMPDYQQTPIAFGATALLGAWGFFRLRIFQLSPLALRAVFDSVGEAVLVVDEDGRLSDVNRLAEILFELPHATSLGRSLADLVADGALPAALETDAAAEFALRPGVILAIESSPILDAGGVRRGRVIVARNIAAQREVEDALRTSEALVRGVVEHSPNGIMRLRPHRLAPDRIRDFTCVLANRAAARYLGRGTDELEGMTLTMLDPPHMSLLFDTFRRVIDSGRARELELQARAADRDLWFRVLCAPVAGDVAVTFINISAHKRRELAMQAAALEDPLTGLLNRRGFTQDAEAMLENEDSAERAFALFYFDLDGFKQINDTWGHEAGDVALVEFTRRLRRCVRGHDLLARVGGDEFVVLATDCGPEEARLLLERFRTGTAGPFRAPDGSEIRLAASIGLASLPLEQRSIAALMNSADAAMYVEKRRGH